MAVDQATDIQEVSIIFIQRGLFFVVIGCGFFLTHPTLALTALQCTELLKEIDLKYMSYVDRKNELESEELISREVVEKQRDQSLREASQLSDVYSAICK